MHLLLTPTPLPLYNQQTPVAAHRILVPQIEQQFVC
jgi:hypothetical protein